VVDSYFALISDRPHRRRFDRIEAEQIIADLAGIEFDPQVAKLLLEVLAEEASESAFPYQTTGDDEALRRQIADQPQPLDEVVYASTYANQQAQIPAESLDGIHSDAVDFAGLAARDEAGIEGQMEIAGGDLASAEAIDEDMSRSRNEMGAFGSASDEAVHEAGFENQPGMAGADFLLPEMLEEEPDKAWAESRAEITGVDSASSGPPVDTEFEEHGEPEAAETPSKSREN
jgi:hypothetical protein